MVVITGMTLKAVAAVSLAGSSYVSGALPAWLGLSQACGQSLLLSLVLCFGGGVLFATSVVHVLPEARLELPDWTDIIFCLGFILLYIIDEMIKLCEGEEKSNCKLEVEGLLDRTIHHRYGSTCEHDHQDNQDEEQGVHDEPHPQISVKVNSRKNNRIGLLVAFSVHSIIEGLVIGVQPAPAKVVLLLGAVSSHKLVIAFCLGAELASDGRSFLSLSRSMLIYSLGSALGIVLGMLIDQKKSESNVSIPVLQALAAGSLLYVTVSEVLPRERSRWEHQATNPFAGIAQLSAFSLGFFVISCLVIFT